MSRSRLIVAAAFAPGAVVSEVASRGRCQTKGHDDKVLGTRGNQQLVFFISRKGAAVAAEIGRILEDDGKNVILQQWDFANRNFMERMDWALRSGARVMRCCQTSLRDLKLESFP